MSRLGRIRSEAIAEWRSFVRRRTAVFFTFLFPTILVLIFGALVRTDPTGGGLFAEEPDYYVAGYLAVVVLFTPMSRVASTVARHREGNRFEKLATTPLSRMEWLAAHAAVNVVLVTLACALVLALVLGLTGAEIVFSPLVLPFLAAGVLVFCGVGALLGRISDSRDGAVAASNTIGLPLVFLSETFVPPEMLPGWFAPLIDLSPLTYFSRGVREVTVGGGSGLAELAILTALGLVAFAVAARALPLTE